MAQWLSYLLPDPAAPGLIPKNFSEEKNVNVVRRWRSLEESEKWLENVDLLLASGKLSLQKTFTLSLHFL